VKRLNTTVHVHVGEGDSRVFGPDDDVPADMAKLITNPAVWADDSAAAADSEPSESWTVPQLRAYAEERQIDLGDATKKADILAALTEADGSAV